MTREFKDEILRAKKSKRWTPEEDLQLYNLVTIFGHNWKKISGFFANTNPTQCKNRWFSCLRFKQRIFGGKLKNLLIKIQ